MTEEEHKRRRLDVSALEMQRRIVELTAILDTLAEPVIIYDAKGIARRVNKVALQVYDFNPIGLSKEAVTRKMRLRHPDGSEVSSDELPSTRALHGETVTRERYVFINAEGRKFIHETSATPLIVDGEVEGAIIVWYDITELEQKGQELRRARDELEARVQERTAELAGVNAHLEQEVRRREQAEKDIRESRRQVLDILESITDGFFALDSLWRFTYINKRAQELLGLKKEYALFKDIWEQLPNVGQCFYEELHKAAAKGEPSSFEFFCPVLSRWIEIRAYPYRTGLSVYFSDVTERKKSEEALRESEKRYRSLVELSPDAIFVLYGETIIYTNTPGMKLLSARTPDELIGKSILTFIHPDYHEIVRERMRLAILGQPAGLLEEKYIRLDGKVIDVEVTAAHITYEGKPAGQVVVRNITERKRIEEELKKSERRFRAIFEQAAVGIAHVDLDGRFMRLNQKYADIVGYTKEALTQKTFQDITYPEDLDKDLSNVEALLDGKTTTYSTEKRYIRKDGSLAWVNLTVSLVRNERGEPQYFIAVVEDISKRKRAEEELRKARES